MTSTELAPIINMPTREEVPPPEETTGKERFTRQSSIFQEIAADVGSKVVASLIDYSTIEFTV